MKIFKISILIFISLFLTACYDIYDEIQDMKAVHQAFVNDLEVPIITNTDEFYRTYDFDYESGELYYEVNISEYQDCISFLKDKREKKENDKKSKSKPPLDLKSKNNSKLKDEKIKNKNLGGLRIKQKALGEEELRAEFYPDEATIYVNTDFPPLKRFIEKRDYENDQFNSLLKEIIATELAVAITAINIQKDSYGNDMTTAMTDLRARINDFSQKFDKL